jgi:hypothetical protein
MEDKHWTNTLSQDTTGTQIDSKCKHGYICNYCFDSGISSNG